MVKCLILVIFLQGFFYTTYSQLSNADEFKIGINLYETLQYEEALKIFNKIASQEEFTSVSTLSLLFKGKTLLELKRYDEAESELLKFIELYPGSNYFSEAKSTLAKIYYEQNNFISSFRILIDLISEDEDEFYNNYARKTAENIALNYSDPFEIEELLNATSDESKHSYLIYILAKLYFNNSNITAAEENLNKLIKEYPSSPEKQSANELLLKIYKIEENYDKSTIVGVVLPLEGDSLNKDMLQASNEILAGIKFAFSEFNRDRDEKVGLLIRNTEMNRQTLIGIKDEFKSLLSLKAVIGPIFSNEVRDALDIFKETDIPVISPTATDNDLTSLNNNFFQANPPFSIRGKIMAQYIYYVENKRKMSVLNAIDGYSPLLSATFIEEFRKLGGEIINNQTYKSNTFSISEPVSKIAADSLVMEGIYIPLADRIDVPMILSQLAQHNVKVPVYGNQDWLLARGFESSSAISNNLTFTSDYFIEYTNAEFQEFSNRFYLATKTDANRNSLYGYDTAKFLLTVIRNVSNTRNIIREKMASGIISRGYHNNISFDEERVNRFLNIVRYREGRFELIDKFKSGN